MKRRMRKLRQRRRCWRFNRNPVFRVRLISKRSSVSASLIQPARIFSRCIRCSTVISYVIYISSTFSRLCEHSLNLLLIHRFLYIRRNPRGSYDVERRRRRKANRDPVLALPPLLPLRLRAPSLAHPSSAKTKRKAPTKSTRIRACIRPTPPPPAVKDNFSRRWI